MVARFSNMESSSFGPFSMQEIEDAFQSFDLDNNTFVGAAELRQIFISLGEEVADEEIDEMIAMVDTDGDGQVSLDEFSKMIFRYAGEPPELAADLMAQNDNNNDDDENDNDFDEEDESEDEYSEDREHNSNSDPNSRRANMSTRKNSSQSSHRSGVGVGIANRRVGARGGGLRKGSVVRGRGRGRGRVRGKFGARRRSSVAQSSETHSESHSDFSDDSTATANQESPIKLGRTNGKPHKLALTLHSRTALEDIANNDGVVAGGGGAGGGGGSTPTKRRQRKPIPGKLPPLQHVPKPRPKSKGEMMIRKPNRVQTEVSSDSEDGGNPNGPSDEHSQVKPASLLATEKQTAQKRENDVNSGANVSPVSAVTTPTQVQIPMGSDGGSVISAQQQQDRRVELKEAAASLGIDCKRLEAVCAKFEKSVGGKSSIDYAGFCRMMEIPADSVLAERMFALFDNDGSKSIDIREMVVGLSSFVNPSKEDRIRFAFQVFDEDKSGSISKEELVKILKGNYVAQSEQQVVKKALAIMRQADKDGDNLITFDEFVDVCHRFPNLLFPVYTATQTATKLVS